MGLRDRCRELSLDIFPDRCELAGRFRDIDARSHINNIAVAELFSEARTQFIDAFFEEIERPLGLYFVVGQQAVYYAGEAHYPGKIEIGTGFFFLGRASLRFGQAFYNHGRCTAIAEGALICTRNGRSTPLPPGSPSAPRGSCSPKARSRASSPTPSEQAALHQEGQHRQAVVVADQVTFLADRAEARAGGPQLVHGMPGLAFEWHQATPCSPAARRSASIARAKAGRAVIWAQ